MRVKGKCLRGRQISRQEIQARKMSHGKKGVYRKKVRKRRS
jgi:hypothetical protein